MTHSKFYTSILTELQAGNVQGGITLLVGMLDAVADDGVALRLASDELKTHDLWQLLLQEPLCAHAAAHPGDIHALGDMICLDGHQSVTSSTGFRLFGVTSDLTFSRAFRERRRQAGEILVRAWQAGRSICLPGCSDFGALAALAGQDLSNIIIADANPDCLARLKDQLGPSINTVDEEALSFLKNAAVTGQRFDLICATELLDALAPDDLAATLSAMQGALAADGKILTASLLPDHLGNGWRRACLGWAIHCHDELQVERAASAAGLTARSYRDATDCVVWAELKLAKAIWVEANSHGH
jgi:hypothetical protein